MSKYNHHMASSTKKHTGIEDLSKLVVQAMEDEPFFNKDVLIPKVKAIMRGFHYNQNLTRYNALENPSDAARRIRTIEIQQAKITLYREKLKELMAPDQLKMFYAETDALEKINP